MPERPPLLALPGPRPLLALPAPAGATDLALVAPPSASPPRGVSEAAASPLAFEDDFTHLTLPLAPVPPPAAAEAPPASRTELRAAYAIEVDLAPAAPRSAAVTGTAVRPAEPDPWSIMPARTLRRAGYRHLVRQRASDEPEDDLLTQAEREPRLRPSAVEPSPGPAVIDRHDLLIVPTRPDFRASDQGVKALILWLDRSQLLRAPEVSSLEEFVGHPGHLHAEAWRSRMLGGADRAGQLIALGAGNFGHQLFVDGEAPKGPPVIISGLIGHRPKPGPVPFGPPGLEAAFWLALIGCRFPRVTDAVLARLHDILHLRPRQHAAPHVGPDRPEGVADGR